jgi:hypothetical protein
VGLQVTSALEQPVYADGAYKPFGDFTQVEVQTRAQELQAATGRGTARVGGVARAWAQLARTMSAAGVDRVRDLDPQAIEGLVGHLWVVPPGGSLL